MLGDGALASSQIAPTICNPIFAVSGNFAGWLQERRKELLFNTSAANQFNRGCKPADETARYPVERFMPELQDKKSQ